MDGSILVATDGTATSSGALRLARELAGSGYFHRVYLLAVFEPLPLHGLGSPELLAAMRAHAERAGTEALARALQVQLDALGIDGSGWEVHVEAGSPAPRIAHFAAEHGVAAIVLGRGGHRGGERWLGSETALRVMHRATVPVLAVDPEAQGLPHRILAATDFSDASRDAAHRALDLLARGGELHLAHVLQLPAVWIAGTEPAPWREGYLADLEIRLTAEARHLQAAKKGRVFWHLLDGHPARELLRLATRLKPELVAAGSHGYGALERLLLGSVSSRLVRAAHCSVLISPPRIPAAAREPSESVVPPSAS